MSKETWLYLYENSELKKIYIGIGRSLGRVFQSHNKEAEELRDASKTRLLQTSIPFSSRKDALMAEAVAIYIAGLSGYEPVYDSEQQDELFKPTNIQGKKSTKYLMPAVYVRDGEIRQEQLSSAIIVPISSERIEGRPSAYGCEPPEIFAERATGYWEIASGRRPQIKHLVAVLTGSHHVILGSWEVDPQKEWKLKPTEECKTSREQSRVSIPIVNPKEANHLDIRGKTYVGRLGQRVSYSRDIS